MISKDKGRGKDSQTINVSQHLYAKMHEMKWSKLIKRNSRACRKEPVRSQPVRPQIPGKIQKSEALYKGHKELGCKQKDSLKVY